MIPDNISYSFPLLTITSPPLPSPSPFSVYVSASKSMDCRLSSGFKGEVFNTFPAPEFAIPFERNKSTIGENSKNSGAKGGPREMGLYVPGALFTTSSVGSESDQSETALNFLPLNWAEKDTYTAATSCLQQLHLPSPSASFSSVIAASSSSSPPSQATYSAILSGKAKSTEQHADRGREAACKEGILQALSSYFKDLGSSGWNVPPSTIAYLAASLHTAASAAASIGTDCTSMYRNQNQNHTQHQNQNQSQRDLVSYSDNSCQNSTASEEWKRCLWGIIRARLESWPVLQFVYLFPSDLEPSLAINGIEFRNFDRTINLEDRELRNFRKIRNEERDRSARKRRNSHFLRENEDIDQGEVFKLRKNEVIDRGIEAEWTWSEKKKENKRKMEQGQRQIEDNNEEENMKESISVHEILGSMDQERNAADRLARSLESALNSTDFKSDATNMLKLETRVTKKNDNEVELFLLNCKEERKKFHSLSILADNVLKQKFIQR